MELKLILKQFDIDLDRLKENQPQHVFNQKTCVVLSDIYNLLEELIREKKEGEK